MQPTPSPSDVLAPLAAWLEANRPNTLGVGVTNLDLERWVSVFEGEIDWIGNYDDGLLEVRFLENESFGLMINATGLTILRLGDEELVVRNGAVETYVWVGAVPSTGPVTGADVPF